MRLLLFSLFGVYFLSACDNADRGFKALPPDNENTKVQIYATDCSLQLQLPEGVEHSVVGSEDCSELLLPTHIYIKSIEAEFFDTEFFQADCEKINQGFFKRDQHLQNIETLREVLAQSDDLDERESLTQQIQQEFRAIDRIYNERNLNPYNQLGSRYRVKIIWNEELFNKVQILNPEKKIILSLEYSNFILRNSFDSFFDMKIDQCFNRAYCEMTQANYCSGLSKGFKILVDSAKERSEVLLTVKP